MPDEPLLCTLHERRQVGGEVARLDDEGRKDHRRDRGAYTENREVDDQDREPPGDAGADRQSRPAFDEADERAEPDREEHAHVDQHERIANEIERPGDRGCGHETRGRPGDQPPWVLARPHGRDVARARTGASPHCPRSARAF